MKNLGLAETVNLAAGAWSKSIIRELGNGGTFASCNTPGIYNIAIGKPETVSDFPKVNGNPIYGYGMMIVTVSNSCTSQLYMSHSGHIAVRQSWYPNKEYEKWFVQYSPANKPSAADIGAFSSLGGKIDGEVYADKFWTKTTLNLGEEITGERHGINIGPVDNASFEGNNVEIRSWYGIGLKSSLDNQTRIFFNPRNGHIGTQGSINAEKLLAKSNVCIGNEDHGIWGGEKDAASFEGNNLEIRSWYGIGLKASTDNETRIVFNTRNGDIGTKGNLLVGANGNSSLKISSHNTANSPIFLYTFGDVHTGGTRHAILEAADDKGWFWYSQRATNNEIQFAVNGKMLPNDYGNFDNRYLQHHQQNIPVGVPLPWSHANPPEGYFECNGQSFDKKQYPKLAMAYPSGIVPDLRGEFIRAWDNGRGIDNGRGLLSYQSPTLIRTAILDYEGNDSHGVHAETIGIPFDNADFTTQSQPNTAKAPNNSPIPGGNNDSGIPGTVSTAALRSFGWNSWWFSTRPRNIAFLYIVRAA
ncbi:tail fiber protein [Xenorhabdus sp. BG5]|uniref:tail fiber protein n=1 Tax=Xenorhabdus sp. BG5 TaxID=2782014 RepID=UPI0018825E5D|nr:tail fiber protein [Xenorhabdus sp. BG5]